MATVEPEDRQAAGDHGTTKEERTWPQNGHRLSPRVTEKLHHLLAVEGIRILELIFTFKRVQRPRGQRLNGLPGWLVRGRQPCPARGRPAGHRGPERSSRRGGRAVCRLLHLCAKPRGFPRLSRARRPLNCVSTFLCVFFPARNHSPVFASPPFERRLECLSV